MTAPKPPKPLTKGGKVSIWFMIVFIAMVGAGGGIALITEGLDGRDALADGPVGTLTPTDRDCGRSSCSWIGEFVSEDGTITRSDVQLRDAVRIRRGNPMPTRIDNVHLHDGAGRPTAYTIDYNAGTRTASGVFLLAFCLVIDAFLVRMVTRAQRPPEPAESAEPAEPAGDGTSPPARA
ncbi:MAG TPA: hypothetical protein VIP77_06060 [Jiangellaceae bacterium]